MDLQDKKVGAGLPRVVYLHGLGSSPISAKAELITHYLADRGFSVDTPDLNLPSFELLSPTLIVRAVAEIISTKSNVEPGGGLDIVGSSFGGFIALQVLAALRPEIRRRIGRLVLLAPAIDPWHPKSDLLSPEIEERWRAAGTMPLFHHGLGREILVHYAFVEELRLLTKRQAIPTIPTLLVHGTRDDVVSYEQSVHLAELCPTAQLVLTDDGHDLLSNPQQLVRLVGDFLSGAPIDIPETERRGSS